MPNSLGYPIEGRSLKTKAKREAVALARQQLDVALRHRQADREGGWRQSENQYRGKHWGETDQRSISDDPTADLITVNMSFSTVNTIVPYTTGSSPSFLVTPFSQDATMRQARIQQAWLNRMWTSSQVDGQTHLETADIDALIYGDGYLKIGYNLEEIRTDTEGQESVAKMWVNRVSPWDIWIDPSADGFHNARWIVQRIRISRTELEGDDRYFNKGENDVTYGGPDLRESNSPDETTQDFESVFDGSEHAVLYEYYNLLQQRMFVFSQDGEYPMRWLDDVGIVPIVQLPNYRIPNSPYHMGELEQLWGLQQELNKTRSQMMTHRRRNVAKVLAREGALSGDAINAIRSGVVNEVVLVQGDEPLDNIIKGMAPQPLTADVYNVSDIVQRDIYEISGVNEYLRGATPQIRRTATEATIIEGASNIKSQHKLRMVERAAKRAGMLLLAIASDVFPSTQFDETRLYITGREAEQINREVLAEEVGDEGFQGTPQELNQQIRQDVLIDPTAQDIWIGDYEVEVEQASTELRNPVLREQKFREMALAMISNAPILMQMGVPLNLKRFLELWFEAAGVDDVEALFEAQQDPMQGLLQQLMANDGGGAPQLPGLPALGNANAPLAPPTEQSSGLLGAEGQAVLG